MIRKRTAVPVSTSLVFHRGYQISSSVLDAIVSDNQRVLWAFIKKDGAVMAVPYTEEQIIWLQASDLERKDEEV